MKKTTIASSIFKTAIFSFSILLLTVFIGCSSKKDENSSKKPEPCEPAARKTQQSAAETNSGIVIKESNEPNKSAVSKKSSAKQEEPSPADVLAKLNTNIGSEKKVELLESLNLAGLEEDPNIIPVVEKALDDPNGDVGEAAIALLDGFESPAILPALEKALRNKDEDVRMSAMDLLDNITDPQADKLLAEALNDPSEDIREAAINMLERQDSIQPAVLESAIASPYENVKDMAISALESRGDKTAVGILIKGLLDQNPEFREKAADALEGLVDHRFESFQQAYDWWNINQSKFDPDLTPIESKSSSEK